MALHQDQYLQQQREFLQPQYPAPAEQLYQESYVNGNPHLVYKTGNLNESKYIIININCKDNVAKMIATKLRE